MSTNDGGPAFPVPADHFEQRIHPDWRGMTLRDWFAGQAMAAMVASHQKHNLDERTRGGGESLWDYTMPAIEDLEYDPENGPEQIARVAYVVADAMLAARNQTP